LSTWERTDDRVHSGNVKSGLQNLDVAKSWIPRQSRSYGYQLSGMPKSGNCVAGPVVRPACRRQGSRKAGLADKSVRE
jgi:hypothetical protein